MDEVRPGKCPHCPAEYSTAVELARHLEATWEHLRERHASADAVVQAAQGYVNSATSKVARYRRPQLEEALKSHRLKFPPDERTPW